MFAIPVVLTFQGHHKFYTLCGGIVSILLYLGLSAIFITSLYSQLSDPQFQSLSTLTAIYESIESNSRPFTIDTDTTIFAVALRAYDPDNNVMPTSFVDSTFRPVFQVYDQAAGKYTVIDNAPCEEVYAD